MPIREFIGGGHDFGEIGIYAIYTKITKQI
jgi:hypothetical protein